LPRRNVRNENTNQLGVLLPNAIVIYNVLAIGGLADHGAQLRLQVQAEHKFQRVSFGLCQGHFGQVKGREFFCVVHLDGTLTFYEQDGISYECRSGAEKDPDTQRERITLEQGRQTTSPAEHLEHHLHCHRHCHLQHTNSDSNPTTTTKSNTFNSVKSQTI